MSSTRLIAYYLPQFHPIPENDKWWGKGFTEWTNAAKGRPLFRNHYQPHIPADLGFYDLRLPETRAAQAEMAQEYGIAGFCYYHYWFGGKRLLERPFTEVLRSGQPDYPFCLCWANESWTGVWHGAPNRILIEQTYPGMADHQQHLSTLLEAFHDPRYLHVDGKPLFLVYKPMSIPDIRRVTDYWRQLAVHSGLVGLYLVGVYTNTKTHPHEYGFDAISPPRLPPKRNNSSWRHPVAKLLKLHDEWRGRPTIYRYADIIADLLPPPNPGILQHPCVIPNWDNTPRSGANGLVLHNSTPELFRIHLRAALAQAAKEPPGHQLIFVKSWNEWAEGNHLEPDLKYGRQYLEIVREELGHAAQKVDPKQHLNMH